MNKPSPLRILIVDDHPVVRTGLRQVGELDQGLHVVGEAADGEQAVLLARRLKPDVVLLDYRLPDLDGHEVCRRIKDDSPHIRVLFLSSFAEAATANAALDAGADGYVLKDKDGQKIVDAIREVHRGGLVIDPAIARLAVTRGQSADSPASSQITQFSAQERRVLHEVASGKPDKDIASSLRLEPKTVRNYLANVYRKLGVRSRTQAALWYHRHLSVETSAPAKKPDKDSASSKTPHPL